MPGFVHQSSTKIISERIGSAESEHGSTSQVVNSGVVLLVRPRLPPLVFALSPSSAPLFVDKLYDIMPSCAKVAVSPWLS